MQFIDLAAQQARVRENIEARIRTVLDHGEYIMGPEVAELENRLAHYAGARHVISCASGTDALLMVLMAWGVGPKDAVFIPSFSFFATAEVVAMLGATPVMVDIDLQTFNIDPASLEKAVVAVTSQDCSLYPLPAVLRKERLVPKAVIPVDLFGHAADYNAVMDIARKYDMLVLEDAAQSFGGEQNGRKICGLGCQAAATSFFPAKPLGAYGDGGAIFTDDDTLASLLRSIRTHGKGSNKYDNVRIGLNGRLDTMQAAVLLAKMDIFAEEINQRQEVAAMYGERLGDIPGIALPVVLPDNTCAWAQYCIRVAHGKRDGLVAELNARGVPSNIYYPIPLHMLTALKDLGYSPEDMPVALEASQVALALPFHPYLTIAQADAVAEAVRVGMR